MITSTKQTKSSQGVDQNQVNEHLRTAILEKKTAQVEAWSQQIETLQESLQHVASDLCHGTEQRLEDLTEARNRARDQLHQLQQATQESWSSMLQQSDEVFQDLAERFHAFTQKQG
ncbi:MULTISPECIES: hypothetical protein [Aphanothece]|uniref:hypothetical protein n=1 Tax=Aphanothece TaxID=1121 RepID=UPI0039853F18